MAAASVTRTSSNARFRSGASRTGEFGVIAGSEVFIAPPAWLMGGFSQTIGPVAASSAPVAVQR
jgi:hypothetical protein